MATRFSNTLVSDITTDARFRAIAQFIEDTLVTTGGWLLSVETGDTAPSELLHPTATNTKKGFRVYKTNDGLTQIYMRIDYGSSSAASGNGLGLWLTIGTGSDGAGTITGIILNGGSAVGPTFASSTSSTVGTTGVVNSYGSASAGRIQLGLFISSTAGNIVAFSIERSKDASGADTSAGLLLSGTMGNTPNIFNLTAINSAVDVATYLIVAGGSQPTPELGLSYIVTRNSPSDSYDNNVGVGLVAHFKGASVQPGYGMCVANNADVGIESTFSTTIYGVLHTYQTLNSLGPCRPTTSTFATLNSSQRMCMQFD